MNKKILKIFSVLVIFLFQCVYVSAEEIFVEKLQNGQTIIVKPVRQNPIVTIDTWIKTGSVNESDANSGVAHFLEHLFFKGTQKHPTGEFEKILESKGAYTNAATGKDYTHYYITLPSKDFNQALELHADMLKNPLIPRKELEKERKVVLEEIARGKDLPMNVAYNNLFKIIYEKSKHPYAMPVIGREKVIESITRDEILNYYNKFYTSQKMYTAIVGDVEPKIAIDAAKSAFGADIINKKNMDKAVYPKILPMSKREEIIEEKNVKNIYMILAFKTPKFADTREAYALDVLSTILGEGKSSKLNRALKEEKQIVNSISSSSSSLLQDGLFLIDANYETKYEKFVLPEIFKQINSIKEGNITDTEILKAKNMIETSTYFARESITNISNELGYCMLYWGNLDYYDNYLSNIKKVTKGDVVKAAKKYLKEDKYAISEVVPEGYLKQKEVSGISNKINNWNAEVLEKTEKATKYKLENGAILITEKNPANSIVAISIANKGGNHLDKIPSTLSLAASLVKEGSKNYSSKEIANFLDENAISLSFSAGNDSFSITVQTTQNQLDNAFFILNELVNNPTFPQNELEKVKKLKLATIKNLEDNSLQYAFDKFKGIAFKGSVYANNSEVFDKNIPLVSSEDIKSAYYSALEPDNLVLSVVGNVDDKRLINEFSQIFNFKNTKKHNMTDFKIQNYIPSKNTEVVIKKNGNKTAWLILGYKTTDVYSKKDIATLKIINAILGDGMSSRLFNSLRESQGLAYQVGSMNYQNALDGAFLTYIGTNPKNLEIAKKGILSEINTMKTEFVTQKELNQAKDKILGNIILELETNMDSASLNAYNATLERKLDYLEEYKNAINSVTQNDVINVANKYFSKPYIMFILK